MDNLVQIFSTNSTGLGVWALMFAASLAGGVIASISPCSLAMLPLIVGYVGGYSKETPLRTFVQLCFFIFGTAIVFSIIGIRCAVTGSVFASTLGGYFTLIMASLLLVMGLKLVGFLDFDFPVLIKEMPKSTAHNTFIYPILLGAVFALIGTPCSTPILAGIMAFASLSANIVNAIIMLFLFSIGQGLILILAGFLTSRLKNWQNFYKISDILMKISGILLILASIYIFYKIFYPLIVK